MSNADLHIKAIMDGVRLFAFRHSRDPEQAKDFLQEGLIAALVAINKYPDREPEELYRILSRCAQNRILDMQRQAVTHWKTYSPLEELDSVRSEAFDDRCERDSIVRVLRERLSVTARRVFDERLDPSWQTQNAFLEDKARKRQKKAGGKLVMGLHSDRITDSHIATALDVSKATVSRATSEIEREGQILLSNQEFPLLQSGT